MKHGSGNHDHRWRFVTNHAHVLECIATNPTARLRDVAAAVGITERTAAQIVNDLEEAGYVTKTRVGRSNHYEVHGELPLRHPQHRHHTVGELIRFLEGPAEPAAPS
jgi:DeoR/GlpR family transcriptional regulator of sugar metabolism